VSGKRLTWLIEAGVYGQEAEPLLAEIRRQGMTVDAMPFKALQKGSTAATGCVLAYGTFPFARQVQLHTKWVPGAWCDPTNLDCTTYFAYFGKFLLNQPYAILSGVEAIRQQDWLYETFGKDDEVFARPSGCHKLFTGRCIYRDDFASGLSVARFDPATLIVIAAPREISREWRLVISGDRVVAGSQYAIEGSKAIEPGCSSEVRSFVELMLKEVRWRPDPIFMADVCEADGKLWLVELNGFSCSWLYGCDVSAVVEAASALAVAAATSRPERTLP
jgi:hypothetical protein